MPPTAAGGSGLARTRLRSAKISVNARAIFESVINAPLLANAIATIEKMEVVVSSTLSSLGVGFGSHVAAVDIADPTKRAKFFAKYANEIIAIDASVDDILHGSTLTGPEFAAALQTAVIRILRELVKKLSDDEAPTEPTPKRSRITVVASSDENDAFTSEYDATDLEVSQKLSLIHI